MARPHAARLLAAAWLALLAGCGRDRQTAAVHGPPEPGGTARIAISEPLDHLTPVLPIRPVTRQLLEHVTPPLGRRNDQGGVQLLLARRYRDSGDALDFILRPARWEDGRPVRAQDVALAARMMLDPRAQSGERSRFDLVRDVSALDDSTVRFRPLILYPNELLDALLMPLPSQALPADPDPSTLRRWPLTLRPLSCGPFRVQSSTGRRLVLERNTTSGFAPPYLDRVEVRQMEPEEAVREFRAGRLECIDDLPVSYVEELRRVPGAQIEALVGRSYVFMGWNLRDSRFADPAVRRAAAEAVDVQRIIREVTLGQGDPARGPLVPALGYVDTSAVFPYAPDAAARRLTAAGWLDANRDGVRERGGAQLAFHILVPKSEELRVDAARAVSRDLARVGIDAEVDAMPLEQFAARLQGRQFEAFMGAWYPDLGLELDPVWSSDATERFNFGGYADAGVDSLLETLHHELDERSRARLLDRLQKRVYAAQPYLFLFQNPRFVALSARLRGADPKVLSSFWNLPAWWIPKAQRAESAPAL